MGPARRGCAAKSQAGKPQSSIYRGVSLHKGTSKFRANIKIKGKKIALGAYDDEIDAAKAFDRAALRFRGERAEVNFPAAAKVVEEKNCGVPADSSVSSCKLSASKAELCAQPATLEDQKCTRIGQISPEDCSALEISNKVFICSQQGAYQVAKPPVTLQPETAERCCDSTILKSQWGPKFVEEIPLSCPQPSGIQHYTPKGDVMTGAYEVVSPCHSVSDGTAETIASTPSIDSHGLRMLESRGFLQYSQEDSDHSSPPCSPHASSVFSPKPCFSEYRDMLIKRSLMDVDEGSDEDMYWETDAQCYKQIQPMTFIDSPVPLAKDAWWRRQLQLAELDRLRDRLFRQQQQFAAQALVESGVCMT